MSTVIGFENGKKKAAVFVAHPDDETIWMGGTILTYRNWEWSIFVLSGCNGRIDRLEKEVKTLYQDNGVSLFKVKCFDLQDSDDENVVHTQGQEYLLKDKIKKIEIDSFDIIFTHNELGEYGHPQHKLLNKVLIELFPEKNIYSFICPGCTNQRQPYKNSHVVVPMECEMIKIKKEIFNNGYPSESYLWTECNDFMVYEFRIGPEIFTKV